jgi:hypothetical protein
MNTRRNFFGAAVLSALAMGGTAADKTDKPQEKSRLDALEERLALIEQMPTLEDQRTLTLGEWAAETAARKKGDSA